eukprot:9476823-Pyramimonas_sp.AAC.1
MQASALLTQLLFHWHLLRLFVMSGTRWPLASARRHIASNVHVAMQAQRMPPRITTRAGEHVENMKSSPSNFLPVQLRS